MNNLDDSDDSSVCEKLVGWLIKRGLWRPKWRFVVAFLILGAGLWQLNFPEMDSIISFLSKQQNDSSVQSIEKIRSIAVNHMKKIYQLSKCETDWLYNINVSKVDFEDEQMARELERMSGGNVEQKRGAILSWRKRQEGNLEQGILATKTLLEEVERLSRQMADIWEPGVVLGSRCIE